MPAVGIFERDKLEALKIGEIGNTIEIAQAEKVPFKAMVRKGPAPKDIMTRWPAAKYRQEGFTGTLDGTDISEFSHSNRETIKGYGMWLMTTGWKVSRIANLTASAGIPRLKEMGWQAMHDGINLEHMIERQLLSTMDTQEESGSDPFQSRGAFSWTDPTEQTGEFPVPANFRPASGCRHTGALSALTTDAFEALLGAAADQTFAPVDLFGLVGRRLKRAMTTWTTKVTVSGEQVLQSYNANIAEKKLQQMVEFFQFDSGKVRTALSFFLACDSATGAETAYTSRSGLFLDMSKWDLAYLDAPAAYQMPHNSGGPRGYHDAVYILRCSMPAGQVSVYTNS
jgi:hypothetical protein